MLAGRHQVGLDPPLRSAAAVTPPTAATLSPAKARASRPNSSNFSRIARTAFTEVNPIHSYRPVTRPLTAFSIWCGVRGGSTEIVGTTCGDRAVLGEPRDHRARPAPWCAARAPASRTAAWSRTRSRRRAAPRPPRRRRSPGRSSRAAGSASATSPRVQRTVRWLTVVPCEVTATGVCGSAAGRQQPRGGGRRRRRRRPAPPAWSSAAGVRGPVDLGAVRVHARATPDGAGRGQRDARRRRGRRSPRRRPGTTSKRDALLAAGGDLLGQPGERRGVAVHQPDDAPARRRGPDDELGAGRPGSSAGRPRRTRRRATSTLGRQCAATSSLAAGLVEDDDVGLGEALDGAQRQQPLVTGAGPDERDLAPAVGVRGTGGTHRSPSLAGRAGRWIGPGGALRVRRASPGACGRLAAATQRRAAPSSTSSWRRAPCPSSCGVVDRAASAERRSITDAVDGRRRRPRSEQLGRRPRPVRRTSASAPSGRGASRLERGEQGPLGGDGGAGRAGRRGGGRARPRTAPSSGAVTALDGERALPGSGQHDQRVEHLGGLGGPAQPQQPGPGQHDRVERARRRRAAAGCRRCRGRPTTSRPRPSARSWAARRGEPGADPGARRAARRGSARRGRPATSRGSSRGGTAASDQAGRRRRSAGP